MLFLLFHFLIITTFICVTSQAHFHQKKSISRSGKVLLGAVPSIDPDGAVKKTMTVLLGFWRARGKYTLPLFAWKSKYIVCLENHK